MTRYFFHLWTGADYQRDECGSELPNADAAYIEAFEAAQDLAIDIIRNRRNAAVCRFDVMSENGQLIFELPFTEVVGTRATHHPLMQTLLRGRTLASEVGEKVIEARQHLNNLRELLR